MAGNVAALTGMLFTLVKNVIPYLHIKNLGRLLESAKFRFLSDPVTDIICFCQSCQVAILTKATIKKIG